MSNNLNTAVIIDEYELLETLVERLASRRHIYGPQTAVANHEIEMLETSSVEAYVSGTLALNDENCSINMPFVSSFMFTCLRRKDDLFRLTWAVSMS
jgi:hypothetical protein